MPTILVIDDNDDFRAYMRALLERQGYHVLALAGARDLGRYVRDRRIDAVITDLYMPQVDGLEVVTFFNSYDPQLPVFGVTGSAEEANSVCVKAMSTFGAREVFTKPLDSARLLAALGRTLQHPTEDAQGILAFEFEDEQDTLTW
jgi:DNA-binding NtrC family response regulator